MQVEKYNNYEELSFGAKKIIIEEIIKKPDLLLCAATGGSPDETYRLVKNEFQKKPKVFRNLRIIKLDEWGGISMDNPHSCEAFLQSKLIQPLGINESRYIGFKSNSENPEEECKRIQNLLDQNGPIDICVLGIGINGHIAFNEPAEYLQPHCHVAQLTVQSLQHKMANMMNEKPGYGLTLGMADILASKKILILISGTAKREISHSFLSGKITTALPASFLWLHHDVTCLIDKSAFD